MSVTIKEKNNKGKKIGMQPLGLAIPKKSVNDDQLVNTVHMIENLSKEKVLEQAILVSDMRGYSAFYFGGVLSVINCNHWYTDYEYTNFVEFVKNKFGISKSTAYDYMAIYENLVESGVTWDAIKHLGWTKIRLIAKYLTKENIEKWIEIAHSKNAIELREFVRLSFNKKQDKFISETPKLSTHVENDNQPTELVSNVLAESIPKTVIYKLFPEQIKVVDAAIKLAMDESETSYKNVALENICMDYLSRH